MGEISPPMKHLVGALKSLPPLTPPYKGGEKFPNGHRRFGPFFSRRFFAKILLSCFRAFSYRFLLIGNFAAQVILHSDSVKSAGQSS